VNTGPESPPRGSRETEETPGGWLSIPKQTAAANEGKWPQMGLEEEYLNVEPKDLRQA